jgi:hypothetical protein
MKLPLKGDTANKLARVGEDLAACEQTILALQQERLAKLLDADAAEIEALDRKIIDQGRVANVYREQIARLEIKLTEEQAEQKRRQRQQAIEKAESVLPQRMAAIYALCRWAKDGVGLVEKLELASKLQGWPPDLERQFFDDVRNDRLLGAIGRAFSGLGGDWNPDRAVQIIGDAAEIEKEHHQSAIDDLKLNPATGTTVASEAA